jgi:hypothetical protein
MTSAQPTNHASEFRPFIIRFGAISLALSGLLFVLYPTVRPWHDESTVGGALSSMSSNAWVAAHLFAILALILMPLGMLGLCALAAGSRGLRLTFAATVVMWIGAGLTLPYYGAEDFALHAIARQVRSGASLDLLGLVDAIRFGGWQRRRLLPVWCCSGWVEYWPPSRSGVRRFCRGSAACL